MLHNIAPGIGTERGGDVQRTCAQHGSWMRPNARALVHHVHPAWAPLNRHPSELQLVDLTIAVGLGGTAKIAAVGYGRKYHITAEGRQPDHLIVMCWVGVL